MRVKIICKDCGNEEFNHGKGLCHKCYMKIQMRQRRKDMPDIFSEMDKKRWAKRREDQNKKRLERFYKNHEENLKKNRAYVNEHRNEVRKQQKEYYQRNIKKIRQRNRDYNKKRDQDKEMGRLRKWVENQPVEKIRNIQRIQRQRRVARKNNLPSTLTRTEWEDIQKTYDYRCAYCGEKKKLAQDHVIPIVKGGGYTAENIVPACKSCNSKKRDKDLSVFLSEIRHD